MYTKCGERLDCSSNIKVAPYFISIQNILETNEISLKMVKNVDGIGIRCEKFRLVFLFFFPQIVLRNRGIFLGRESDAENMKIEFRVRVVVRISL